jgi:BRCT domain type II-containing protein
MRKSKMLKSYAVALVLATTTPVAIKSEESVQAPVKSQATTATTSTSDTSKNGVKVGKNW